MRAPGFGNGGLTGKRYWTHQRIQQCVELSLLSIGKPQRLQFCLAGRRGGRAVEVAGLVRGPCMPEQERIPLDGAEDGLQTAWSGGEQRIAFVSVG
jgi:hypothetical protein